MLVGGGYFIYCVFKTLQAYLEEHPPNPHQDKKKRKKDEVPGIGEMVLWDLIIGPLEVVGSLLFGAALIAWVAYSPRTVLAALAAFMIFIIGFIVWFFSTRGARPGSGGHNHHH
jgi:hypothetical protein